MRRPVLAAALLLAAAPAAAGPVLMISVDGLRPADVIAAERTGLAVPTLRRMMATGAYAEGVTGVLPTLTYPPRPACSIGSRPNSGPMRRASTKASRAMRIACASPPR